jgi:hypothetical protein
LVIESLIILIVEIIVIALILIALIWILLILVALIDESLLIGLIKGLPYIIVGSIDWGINLRLITDTYIRIE